MYGTLKDLCREIYKYYVRAGKQCKTCAAIKE